MKIVILCLVFSLFVSAIQCRITTSKKTSKFIFLDMEEGSLKEGDNVVLRGRFITKRIVQIRFMSSPSACTGGVLRNSARRPQCQPIIVRFHPETHYVKIFYKGKPGSHKDQLLAKRRNEIISPNNSYNLTIHVGKSSYTLYLNDQFLTNVKDKIGHQSVIKMRAYGGNFSEFNVSDEAVLPGSPGRDRAAPICGIRKTSEAEVRIIRGTKAKAREYPWQVALRRKVTTLWSPVNHMCGASLINSCWILTAAHCLVEVENDLDSYSVRVGDLYNKNDSTVYSMFEDQQDLELEQIYIHPNFTSYPSPRNDIGIIKVESGRCATYSDFVQPICLPTPNDSFPTGSPCEISGWGAKHVSDSPEDFPSRLQRADIRIQNLSICKRQYGKDDTGEYRVVDQTVCASEKGVDACQGDSGGPLACQRPNAPDNFVLWGITSWGDGCASSKKPHGIYTKVVDYLDWINGIMSGHVVGTDRP